MELLQSNLKMLRKLQKMESDTKFDDLQSEWIKKKRLRDMVSVVSSKRLKGLTKTHGSKATLSPSMSKDAQYHYLARIQKEHELMGFQTRNQSMSPNGMNDTVRRDISESAMKNNASQLKTATNAFNSPSSNELQNHTAGAEDELRQGADQKLDAGSGQLINVQTDPKMTINSYLTQPIRKLNDDSEMDFKKDNLLQDELHEVGSIQRDTEGHNSRYGLMNSKTDLTIEEGELEDGYEEHTDTNNSLEPKNGGR